MLNIPEYKEYGGEATVSRVSELMRFLRRKVKTEDLIDLPSAEEWISPSLFVKRQGCFLVLS